MIAAILIGAGIGIFVVIFLFSMMFWHGRFCGQQSCHKCGKRIKANEHFSMSDKGPAHDEDDDCDDRKWYCFWKGNPKRRRQRERERDMEKGQ
jgi:hypothetical protein